jgi:RNA polymerase sigma-70 factor (ECF subfamily)
VQKINKEIIECISKGDIKAFEHLYTAYYVYLCTVAVKYIYDPEVAKEIVNDVFLCTWHNRTSLKDPVTAYLIRAVQNRCINHLQRKRTQEVPLTDMQEQLLTIQEQAIGVEEQPLAYLENKEFEELISSAINTLPPKCKLIFQQYLYQHKSYEEIAQTNGISPNTVRVQIKIGLSKIKDLIKEEYCFLFFLIFFEK